MHRLCIVLHGLFQNLVLLQHGNSTLLILQREGTVTDIPPGPTPPGRQADHIGGKRKDPGKEAQKGGTGAGTQTHFQSVTRTGPCEDQREDNAE